ncbi:MAG: undecaprenyl-phosphate glucose phosphotransferase, partial [Lachnospiraceae bacterium]|nr:undecaprenyl-phosphate glucose phosphotransferase [Lachnospiraceae bacterium]
MIKDNQKYFNRLHVVLDAVIVAASYMLAWYLKFASPFSDIDPNVGVLSMSTYFEMLYAIVPGYLILYYAFHLYTPKRATAHRYEIINIFQANTVGMVVMMAGWYMVAQIHFSRTMMAMFYGINIFLTTLGRSLIRMLLQYFREKGYNLKYILLVGYSRATEEYINRINTNPQWGYVVRGILDDSVPSGTVYKGVKVVGSIENLLYILPQNKLDEIAITLPLKDYDKLEHIVDLCEKSGVHTKFIPDYNSLFPSRPYTEDLMGLPVVNIRYVPLTITLHWWMKRLVDDLVS